MKLASVKLDGKPTFGAVTDRGFVDLGKAFGTRCADLRQLIASGLVGEAQRLLASAPAIPLDRVAFERVIPNLDARTFALGWSYKDHQDETGKEAPKLPFLFSKHPQALVGHKQLLVKPRISERYDFEGEIALVIGKAGRHISATNAMAMSRATPSSWTVRCVTGRSTASLPGRISTTRAPAGRGWSRVTRSPSHAHDRRCRGARAPRACGDDRRGERRTGTVGIRRGKLRQASARQPELQQRETE